MKLRTTLCGCVTLLIALSIHQFTVVQGANILGLFAHPGKSHFDVFRPLFLGLAEAGHKITMISYFPNKEPVANYTDHQLSGMPVFTSIVDLKVFGENKEFIPFKVHTFFMLHEWGMQACGVAFNSEIIKKLLSTPRPKFDVIILEQFNNDCMMAVAHQLNAPIISLSSCALMPWHYQRMGSPFLPSFMPMNFLPHTEKMEFLERVNNFVHFHAVNLLYDYYTQKETNALIRQHFGTEIPRIEKLVKKTSLMLINQHFSLTGAVPYAPNIVEVGGLQIMDEKPLPTNLKTLLDNASNGVVLMSWGSMIRPETLPEEKRVALLQSFAKFPKLLFLMKWPNDSIPNKPKNLHILKWLPQRDILCHPNSKAFMAHGGLLGASEAAYCGVPMLVTPIYGDQFLNSVKIVQRKLGVIVEYKDLTTTKIVEGMKTILEPSFNKQVKLLSDAFKSRPQKPVESAIWWVEHVIQTKGAPLTHSESKNLNWFILNSFDIYLFLIACVFVIIYLVRALVKTCLIVFRKRDAVKVKKH